MTLLGIKNPVWLGSQTAGIADDDLKTYWRMNETSGTLVNSSTATADLGSAADLTVAGSPTYNQTGSPSGLGNNMLWGASGAKGTAGSSTSQFNFLHNLSALFTLSVWLKFPSPVVTNNTLLNDNNFSDVTLGLNIRTQGNSNFRILIGNGSTNVLDATMSTNSIPTDNAFHFYCFRFDYSLGSNHFKYRYDDGNEELFSKTANAASNSNSATALDIADYSGASELAANMLEMSVFNRILTADEETTLYASGNGATIY
jgi:hypothetical protein